MKREHRRKKPPVPLSSWSLRQTVYSTFSRSGWSVVRNASVAKGDVLRKTDRHRTSTKFRLWVIRWIHELSRRLSCVCVYIYIYIFIYRFSSSGNRNDTVIQDMNSTLRGVSSKTVHWFPDFVRIKFRWDLNPSLHRFCPWLLLILDSVSLIQILWLSQISSSISPITSRYVMAQTVNRHI
jgi:hypothetical protein